MRLKKWLVGWGIAGLIAPLIYLAVYFLASYDLFIFPLWPGAAALMVLENRPPIATAILIWLAAISSNVIVYAFIGLLLWPLARIESKGPDSDNGG